MNLETLKLNWQMVGADRKDPSQLLKMTKIKNHPHIKRMRIRFLIEAVMLIIFIAIYNNAFDGATKPLWANIILIVSSLAYIITRFTGWLIIRNPINGINLKTSLLKFKRNLKRIGISIIITSFCFGLSVILFFSSTISFTKSKYLMVFIMVIFLAILFFVSAQNWIKKIREINKTILEIDETINIK